MNPSSMASIFDRVDSNRLGFRMSQNNNWNKFYKSCVIAGTVFCVLVVTGVILSQYFGEKVQANGSACPTGIPLVPGKFKDSIWFHNNLANIIKYIFTFEAPNNAIQLKPVWITGDLSNETNASDSYLIEKEVVIRTGHQVHTIVLECQSEDAYSEETERILELLLKIQNDENETSVYLPQFWIRLAQPENPGNENTSACFDFIDYAVRYSLHTFQGVLIEADALLNLSVGNIENEANSSAWDVVENGTINVWNNLGVYNVGLMMDKDSCRDVLSRIPKTLLHKFNKLFYLENIEEVDFTDERLFVSISKNHENCNTKVDNEFSIESVIPDLSNISAILDYPICVTYTEI